jgi:hypothetical protein
VIYLCVLIVMGRTSVGRTIGASMRQTGPAELGEFYAPNADSAQRLSEVSSPSSRLADPSIVSLSLLLVLCLRLLLAWQHQGLIPAVRLFDPSIYVLHIRLKLFIRRRDLYFPIKEFRWMHRCRKGHVRGIVEDAFPLIRRRCGQDDSHVEETFRLRVNASDIYFPSLDRLPIAHGSNSITKPISLLPGHS